MNTRIIMTASAVLLALAGVALSFLPQEINSLLVDGNSSPVSDTVLQVLGAVYFGFAMTNWTAKGNLIGGIYGRPIAIGNMAHFLMGALALIKAYASTKATFILWAAIVYLVFAVLFFLIFFTHPLKNDEMATSKQKTPSKIVD